MFDRKTTVGWKAHPSKYVFDAQEVLYKGNLLSFSDVMPMEAKVKTIVEMPAPVDVFGVRSFMGLEVYYRKFVPNFSNLAKPLNELTQVNTPFEWTKDREGSFHVLKNALISSPVWRAPDVKCPFTPDVTSLVRCTASF